MVITWELIVVEIMAVNHILLRNDYKITMMLL